MREIRLFPLDWRTIFTAFKIGGWCITLVFGGCFNNLAIGNLRGKSHTIVRCVHLVRVRVCVWALKVNQSADMDVLC